MDGMPDPATITFRTATEADGPTMFDIFTAAVADLGRRTGTVGDATAGEPDAWAIRRPLFDHLAATGDGGWIAELDGSPIGYARSIVRDGVRELTEFFVLPRHQRTGIGRALLERSFPGDDVRHRAIIATTDPPAIGRYLGTGLLARLAIAGFEAAPTAVTVPTDLVAEPIDPAAPPFGELATIDRAVLDLHRDVDHAWFARERAGWLYRRDGRAVAYGYHPRRPGWGGPYAALDPDDLPVVLAGAETAAAEAGHPLVTFDVPLIGRAALDHLRARRFRIDPFLLLYFSDGPIDGLDRYVLTSPPFFL